MSLFFLLLLLSGVVQPSTSSTSYVCQLLTTFPVTHPVFLSLAPSGLLVTSVDVSPLTVSSGAVHAFTDVGNLLLDSAIPPSSSHKIKSILMPSANSAMASIALPAPMFGPSMVLITSNSVQIMDLSSGHSYPLTPSLVNGFYRDALVRDFDEDGRSDVIVTRFTPSASSTITAELVCLTNPGALSSTELWKEQVLFTASASFFRLVDLNGDGREDVVTSKLVAYLRIGLSDWSAAIMIDNKIDFVSDITTSDFNGDGRLDLLVSSLSEVYAYEIPSNLTSTWRRHELASGLVIQPSPSVAATILQPVNLSVGELKSPRPSILVTGGASGILYLLQPMGESQSWDCTKSIIAKFSAPVGQIAVGDVFGDNAVEIFVPDYMQSQVAVFSFVPFSSPFPTTLLLPRPTQMITEFDVGSTSSQPTPAPANEKSDKTAVTAVFVVILVVVFSLAAILIWWYVKRRRSTQSAQMQDAHDQLRQPLQSVHILESSADDPYKDEDLSRNPMFNYD